MDKASREKIALIVFVLLIVLGLCGFIGYLAIGHSWNVAATNIDDAAGSLDGYTAILYDGTQQPEREGVQTPGGEGTQPPEGEGAQTPQEEGAQPPEGTGGDPAASDGQGNAASGNEGSGAEAPPQPLSILEVQQSYLGKNAETLILDAHDIGEYYEGMILKKGDRRIGVFSVQETDRLFTIMQKVLYFKRYHVDFIVALTPDMKYVGGAHGIDIVISTQNENLFAMGETIDGTFYTSAPVVGDVGVVLISPSNVITSKDISSL